MPILWVLGAILSIQSGAALSKRLFLELGPAGTTALRLSFATLLLMAFWRPWKRLKRQKLSASEKRVIALYGLTLGLMNLGFYFALERIPLGLTVALEFLGPLAVALFASKRRLDLLWVAFAISGVALISLPSSGFLAGTPSLAGAPKETLDPIGVGYALFAGLGWGLYILISKRAGERSHVGIATSIGMAVASGVALPPGFAQAGFKLLDVSFWPIGLAVALLSSVIPYSLEMAALRKIPTRTFGILMSLEPAVAALLGLTLLGERLSGREWIAIGCVVSASLGTVLSARKAKGTKSKATAIPA